MKSVFRWRIALSVLVAGIVAGALGAVNVAAQSADDTVFSPVDAGGKSTQFIGNVGQWDADADYLLTADGLDVWLTGEGPVYQVSDFGDLEPASNPPIPASDLEADDGVINADYHVVKAEFVGANDSPLHEQLGMHPGDYNYLSGGLNATGARASANVAYRDVWSGIDMIAASAVGSAMKVSYEVAPGANPGDIQIDYVGADSVSIDDTGALIIETSLGDIVETAPSAFQRDGNQTRGVPVAFSVSGTTVSFVVGAYNNSVPLIIDPTINYSSRIAGGSSSDYTSETHLDAQGNTYVTGFTFSSNYPTTTGAYQTSSQGVDLFATKVDAGRQNLVYSTYLGSTSTDYGGNSALAGDGSIYVVGHGFGTAPAGTTLFGTSSGSYDQFIFHLSADGSSLISSAELRSSSTDYLGDVEIASNGDIYVTGTTLSSNYLNGVTFTGWDTTHNGGYDITLTRLNSGLSSILNHTYIGSSSSDGGSSIGFDGSGNVYVHGFTLNAGGISTTFTEGPLGNYDNIVGKFNSSLTSNTYLGAIGGTSTDMGVGFSYTSAFFYQISNSGLIIDSSNRAWFTAATASSNFPTTTGAFQTSNGGNYDANVTAINAAGTGLDLSTYLGGSSTDFGKAIDFDALGNVYVVGGAFSTNFPTTMGEVQETNGGSYDYFATIFESDLSALVCSTYFGGSSTDIASSVIPLNPGVRLISGFSTSTNFPEEPSGTPTFGPGGGYDVGLAEINCGGANLSALEANVLPVTNLNGGRECLAAGDFVDFQIIVENTGLNDQPDLPGPEVELNLTGNHIAQSCVADSGTCSITSNSSAEWNGAIPTGGMVSITLRTRIAAGVRAGSELCVEGFLNFDGNNDGTNGVQVELEPVCAVTDCPPTVFPNIQLGSQVHLPILNFQGQDDVCETWIEVQNLGCDFAKAALITWGEPGFCPPQAAGPLKVECTGMLKPGSTWNLLGAQVPTGSKSGILFKFTTQQLSEIGVDLGFDDITGDYLCETLFFGVVGDADDYRRFKKAYNEGLEFAGVPLDRAMGDGVLAVDVHRTCPGDTTPGVEVTSKYNGLASEELGTFDDLFGGYGFYVPLIYADAADFNTIMYIQNGGLQCSSVEVWFKARDDCLRASICEILTLAPGESYQLDANDCVGPDFQGSAWLRSSQVMGIAVDIIGRDVLMTYVAEPAEINYTFDPNSAVTRTAQQVAFGPLIYSEYQGWDTGIQVQNMSGVTAAKVKVYFLDRSGDIITTLVDWVCPRGSQTFFLPVIFDLPGNWVGSVRVESQEWFTPGGPLVLPPNITAVATLIKYNDAARTETTEAIAYNLLPEHKIYDWQIGFGAGGLDSGVGLIAIPSLIRDLQGTGVTSELAIANVVPKPGFTDLVIYFYDQNGLLDYVCQKLNEKQVEYIDLQTWGYINEGFKGSAIISAWFWEHDVFGDDGFFIRNLVGLGAVAIERKGTRLGEDVPGDEAAGARGIPFREFVDEDAEFEFCFMGYPPLCPGWEDTRFGEGEEDTCRRYPGGLIEGTVGSGVSTPGVVSISGVQGNNRLGRFNDTGLCPDGNACPGPFGAPTSVNYDAIFFDNCEGGDTCVTITFQWLSGGFRGQAAFYLNDYDPDTDICLNHLADNGNTADMQMFGADVPAGQTLVVVVADIFAPGVGGNYEFTLDGDLP